MKNIGFSIYFLLNSLIAFSQWTLQNPLPQCHSLGSVAFTSASDGYTVGNYGTIIKTTDGCTIWTPLSSGTTKKLNMTFPDEACKNASLTTGVPLPAQICNCLLSDRDEFLS